MKHPKFHLHALIRRRPRLAFVLILILVVASAYLAVFLVRTSSELRRQAGEQPISLPQSVPLLVMFSLDPATHTVSLTRATQLPPASFPPTSHPPTPNSQTLTPNLHYTLVQTYAGQPLATTPITFITHIYGESSSLINPQAAPTNPIIPLDHPFAILRLDYYLHADLKLQNPTSKQDPTLTNLDTLNTITLNQAETNTSSLSLQSNDNSTNSDLDLLFLSNGYTSSTQFTQDATAMFNYLLTLSPFNQFATNIHATYAFTTTNLQCYRPPNAPGTIVCDTYQVNLVAAAYPHDSIIVIDNSNDYGGAAYIGQNILFVYRDVNSFAKQVMAHEFGHSFGGLADEYNISQTYSGDTLPPPFPNCDYLSSCPNWSGHPEAGCYQVCSYSNLYRPTDNSSLMRTIIPDNGPRYGPVSEEHLRYLLSLYVPPNPLLSDYDGNTHLDFLDDYRANILYRTHPDLNIVNRLYQALNPTL